MQQEKVSDMALVIVSDLSKAGKKNLLSCHFMYICVTNYVHGKLDYEKCNIAKHYV